MAVVAAVGRARPGAERSAEQHVATPNDRSNPSDAPDEDRTKAPPERPLDGPRVVVYWQGGHATCPLPREGRVTLGRSPDCDLHVRDESVSRTHAAIHGGHPAELEDLASANGTRLQGVALAPHERRAIPPGAVIEIGSAMAFVHDADVRIRASGHDALALVASAMQRVHQLVELVAPSDISVVLLGETGVGKGVIAEAIHRRSPRGGKPFLPLNCGALPESVLESELFGHERGAFTGAVEARLGLIESANGGTVLLDEVGDLPLTTQAKLLRVIENRDVLRVGGRRPMNVDVRFVAATNKDLVQLVAHGTFREDLYHRLDGISITIPPLRERRDEIDGFARAFLAEAAAKAGRSPPELTPAAVSALHGYDWPGNVRELRNVVERAVLLAAGGPVAPEHVLVQPRATSSPDPAVAGKLQREVDSDGGLRDALTDLERNHIVDALERAGGNQTRAAELLGISRRTLLRRLDAHALTRPRKGSDKGS